MADDLLQKQRGRPFPKGQSGNPAGRPPGLRNRATEAAAALLDGEAEALTRKAVELALGGDRIALPRRERPVAFDLPPLRDVGDGARVMAAVADAAASGMLAPGEAGELARVVETWLRAVETGEFERRLAALEAGMAAAG